MAGSVSWALRDEAKQSESSTAAKLICSSLVRLENRLDLIRMNLPVSEWVGNRSQPFKKDNKTLQGSRTP